MSAQKAHQHGYQLDDGGIPRQQLRMRLRRLAAHHAARPTVAAAPRRPVAEARVLKSTESSGRAAPTWPVPDVSIAMSQRGHTRPTAFPRNGHAVACSADHRRPYQGVRASECFVPAYE